MTTPGTPAGLEAIAIIGMAGRFPMARNLDEYWQNLRDGRECISVFSDQAGEADALDVDAAHIVRAGGLLEDLDLFDARFFGFSARDAELADPQQRIFLECAWHSLEDAGYDPEFYAGLIGVFAGTSTSSYMFDLYANARRGDDLDSFRIAIGNEKDHLATQTSYKLNLRGPSISVQTACSTSLVAVCLASQSLLNYQCDLALAGGVSADLSTADGYYYQAGGILSPDGHCRAFDAAARGTVPGNGVGIVVLKRLSEAIADRDHIRAVIKGFALNNDGSQKVGYTAPSVDGQAEVVALAQAMADVHPETISYIETHGTGTVLGDPIEIAALEKVFGRHTRKTGFCRVGSVKSNIGHLDSAAGVASLIKTVLALEHEQLPPSLHFSEPNPKIDFARSPFYVNSRLSKWPSDGTARRAGVSCFGIGGTNAHVVLEEAPVAVDARASRDFCLITLSARTDAALDSTACNLINHLDQHSQTDLADVAYTLHVGRKTFAHRRAVVCRVDDRVSAVRALAQHASEHHANKDGTAQHPVLFMFPGQGTQKLNMGLELYRTEPAFRAEVDRCSERARPFLERDLREVMYPREEFTEAASVLLHQTAYAQPALFTIEYALAKLLSEWGVRPAAMIGHSIGEYVAACLAGVFDPETAIELVARRGQLMQTLPPGAMLAVPMAEAALTNYLGDDLSIAAVNASAACVVAGPSEAVAQLESQLSRIGVAHVRLATSHAFHSRMVDPIQQSFVMNVAAARLNPPTLPYISSVTGSWVLPEEATDPHHWGNQLRESVRFHDGLQQLLAIDGCTLLEVGPGRVLSNLAGQHPERRADQKVLACLPYQSDRQSDTAGMLRVLGELWRDGAAVSWEGFHAHEQRRRISLPTYPFERQRYGIAPSGPPHSTDATESDRRDITEWLYYPAWEPDRGVDSGPVSAAVDGQTRWLVFGAQHGLGAALVGRLRARGQEVTNVVVGDAFRQLPSGDFAVNPRRRADYQLLLDSLRNSTRLPNRIVHAWSVGDSGHQAFDTCQERGFYSLAFLVQALGKSASGAARPSIQLDVLVSRVQAVLDVDLPLCPGRSTVVGLCKVIPQEHPDIRCRVVDVDYRASYGQARTDALLDLLEGEFARVPVDPVVAYRRARRWVQTFEAVNWSERPPGDERGALRHGGVYLITGGVGNLGLTMADCLTRAVQATLVLTTRSAFPERREWPALLDGSRAAGAEITKRRIAKLLELERMGATVNVFSVDAADREAMERIIHMVESRFRAIHGVIHAAGDISQSTAIDDLDRPSAERQFRAKVRGLLVLDELLRSKQLDFMMVVSSLASVLGGLGLGAYAAANSFIDTLAQQRSREGETPWITVNWDAWRFAEPDSSFDSGLLPEEGAELFHRIINRSPRQVIVSTTDLHERWRKWVLLEHAPVTQQNIVVNASTSTFHPRPQLQTEYAPPTSPSQLKLVNIWQELLGVEPVGIADDFFELGGHSLLAIQLISRIQAACAADVSVQRVFEAPTVEQLAKFVDANSASVSTQEAEAADLLTLVEQLSESELTALLQRSDAARDLTVR